MFRGRAFSASLGSLLGLFGASGTGPEATTSLPWPAEASRAVGREELRVTTGAIAEVAPGVLAVEAPSVRAVLKEGTDRRAELRFKYLGPTRESAPLASGETRRQIALKLRAKDGCNVVYAAWRIEPVQGVVVSVKRNPGMATHTQCGARGYRIVRPERSAAVPEVRAGVWHTLAADLQGGRLRVFADGVAAWEGDLPAEALAFDGPVGARADNGRFELSLRRLSSVAFKPGSPP